MDISVTIKILSPLLGRDMPLPKIATEGAAGLDLRACIENPIDMLPGEHLLVPSGFAAAIPPGYAGFVFARSGLAIKSGVCLSNGVGLIDSDYRGEIKVGLFNSSREAFRISTGDRVAQLCVMPVCACRFEIVDELGASMRGEGGFGSTGRA
jgi:dUTP pyrophosphatase